jgi:hypothetical protein
MKGNYAGHFYVSIENEIFQCLNIVYDKYNEFTTKPLKITTKSWHKKEQAAHKKRHHPNWMLPKGFI